jgi:peptidoglycan/xylan/chitin deacetylase (PgdA/CDA1 family)
MYLRKILNVLGVTFLASSSLVSAQGMINNCNEPGYVAITYDDGPNVYTSDLVQLLNDNDVKATFFVNGDNFL